MRHISKPSKENPRDRVLSDDEICTIWQEAVKMRYPYGPLIQILMLTGQRKSEVSEMCWSEINLKDKVWMIPKERAKNGLALPKLKHLAPLRTAQTDGVLHALLKLPWVKQLESLSLAGRTLSNGGAARAQLAHLKTLDLSGQRGQAQASLSTVDITALSPDAATLKKAKALANAGDWPKTGKAGDVFWGQCQGSDLYDVTLRTAPLKATCTCFANAYNSACKHAVGLALLVSQGHPFHAKPAPFSLQGDDD